MDDGLVIVDDEDLPSSPEEAIAESEDDSLYVDDDFSCEMIAKNREQPEVVISPVQRHQTTHRLRY